jgi:hypothetical protein
MTDDIGFDPGADRNIRTGQHFVVREGAFKPPPVDWRLSQKGNPYARRYGALFVVALIDKGRDEGKIFVSFTLDGDTRWHPAHVHFPGKIERLYDTLDTAKSEVAALKLVDVERVIASIRGDVPVKIDTVESTSAPERSIEPGERRIRL